VHNRHCKQCSRPCRALQQARCDCLHESVSAWGVGHPQAATHLLSCLCRRLFLESCHLLLTDTSDTLQMRVQFKSLIAVIGYLPLLQAALMPACGSNTGQGAFDELLLLLLVRLEVTPPVAVPAQHASAPPCQHASAWQNQQCRHLSAVAEDSECQPPTIVKRHYTRPLLQPPHARWLMHAGWSV
jgi:hypothetical protein